MSKTDSISRQLAIEKLKRNRSLFCKNRVEFQMLSENDKSRVDEIDTCISVLLNLPSVQSERQINLDGAETPIEILSELRSQFNCFDGQEEKAYHALSVAIHALSAQSELKKGKWIDSERPKWDGTTYFLRQCSVCGYERTDCNADLDTAYCPNCGADMKGE